MNNSEFLLYQNQEGNIKVDVRLEVETVWLTQDQMAQVFGKGRSTVTEPIIYVNLLHIEIWNNYFLRFFWCLNYGSR